VVIITELDRDSDMQGPERFVRGSVLLNRSHPVVAVFYVGLNSYLLGVLIVFHFYIQSYGGNETQLAGSATSFSNSSTREAYRRDA
jgi:hypothetical protein